MKMTSLQRFIIILSTLNSRAVITSSSKTIKNVHTSQNLLISLDDDDELLCYDDWRNDEGKLKIERTEEIQCFLFCFVCFSKLERLKGEKNLLLIEFNRFLIKKEKKTKHWN